MKIVFVTNNKHKLDEVKKIVAGKFEVVSLEEIGCYDDIPETADTLEGNALLKAEYIKERYGLNCFADDTGLEVETLNNAPGVYSARYAGNGHDSKANMLKLLAELNGKVNRKARFRTAISLIIGDEKYLFEGIINGVIGTEEKGQNGFGYDPVFIPDGYTQTFAELGDSIKNSISHRAKAVIKLNDFLLSL